MFQETNKQSKLVALLAKTQLLRVNQMQCWSNAEIDIEKRKLSVWLKSWFVNTNTKLSCTRVSPFVQVNKSNKIVFFLPFVF